MADKNFKKRKIIEISSTDASESSLPESDDNDSVEEISSFTPSSGGDGDGGDDKEEEDDNDDDGSEWNDSEDEDEDETVVDEDEVFDDAHVDKDDQDSMCKKVIKLIRGRSDLQELKLIECKAYLRLHGLRLSGTKEECMERILEHWRLKDGNGEAFYPKSSFTIDCTGDVCKGDVVLFNQKVYQKFDKIMRCGSHLGRRTVAGRVVKESYGIAKQQHTFTVEVLWNRGTKKLPPLFPLLVKGRNLYRLKTFRQRWKNEKNRLEVLAEKHERGDAARTTRAMRKRKAAMRTNNKSTKFKDAKRCKHLYHAGPSGTRETTHSKKNSVDEHGKVLAKNKKRSPYQNKAPTQTLSLNQYGSLRHPASHGRYQSNQTREPSSFPYSYPSSQTFHNSHSDAFPREMFRRPASHGRYQSNQSREPSRFPYSYPSSQTFHNSHSDAFPREMQHLPSHRGSSSMVRLSYSNPLPNSGLKPISDFQEFNHGSFMDPAY